MLRLLTHEWTKLTSDVSFSEILTGSVWALSARVLAVVLGLGSSIIIARIYGAEVVGIVAVVNSFLMMATIFTLLGTHSSVLRLIPEHVLKFSFTSALKVYRKSQNLVIVNSLIAGSLFFWGASLIAHKLFSKPHLSFYFALAAVFVVFKSLMLFNTQAVRGLKLTRVFAFMQVLPQGLFLLFLMLLGLSWSTMDVPVYAFLCSIALTGIVGWGIMEYAFRKRTHPQDKVQSIPLRTILTISLPMLITTSMQFVISQTGVIMLGIFRTDTEVGYYAVSVNIANLTTFMLMAINSISGPKFSELFHSDRIDELLYVAKKSTKLIFWTTAPILLALVLFGRYILSYVYGSQFAIAYPALLLLVGGQFVNSVSGSTALFMNMTGSQKSLRNIVLIAAMGNIGLNLLLIPVLGIIGAAISATVSVSYWNITTLLYIKRIFGKTIGYLPSFD